MKKGRKIAASVALTTVITTEKELYVGVTYGRYEKRQKGLII